MNQSSKFLPPLLSLCIPNYNRASFLWQNLEAIARQNNPATEIVVSDDDSSEDIDAVIKRFHHYYPRIHLRYKRQRRRLGFDRNVLASIALARGKFCWLLSNDDRILPGSLSKILNLIENHPSLAFIFVNYSRFDNLTGKMTAKRMVSLNRSRFFTSFDDFYFYRSQGYFPHLGTNMITMSANLFRRSYWREAVRSLPASAYIGHNFIHLFLFTSLIRRHPVIYYLSQPQLRYLAGNQRTWPNQIWRTHNTIFLDFMLHLGYDPKKIKQMRYRYRIFELRELFTKLKPALIIYQKLFSLAHKFEKLL